VYVIPAEAHRFGPVVKRIRKTCSYMQMYQKRALLLHDWY